MFCTPFKIYIFLIQCIIFHNQYNFVMSLFGPNVRQVEENEFPAIVSIMSVRNFSLSLIELFHKCSGTLISRQDVVTAEHCLRTTFSEGFKVMVGSHDLFLSAPFFPLFIWTYDHWILFKRRTRESEEHDIALIKLTANVPDRIAFSPIGNIANEHLYGLNVVAVGWGRLMDNTKPRFAHAAALKVISKADCENRYYAIEHEYPAINARFLCTVGNPFALLNQGDSGGPLFYNGALIAINNGVCPTVYGTLQSYQINLHLGIRYYHEFFDDVIRTFHMTF